MVMEMNKKLIIGMTLGIALMVSGIIVTAASAENPSYVVCGIVVNNNGTPTNGATITVTNEANPSEYITVTSYTDVDGQSGTYQVNLGNMPSVWHRGDNITVSAESGSWTGSVTFTIPATGTMKILDNVSMNKTTSKGGGRERGANVFGGSFGGFGAILIVVLLGIVIGVLWFIFAGTKNRNDNKSGRQRKKYKVKL
jgi:hypothetical protein